MSSSQGSDAKDAGEKVGPAPAALLEPLLLLPPRPLRGKAVSSPFVSLLHTFCLLFCVGVPLLLQLFSPDFQDRSFLGLLEGDLLSLPLTICSGTQVRNPLSPDGIHLQIMVPRPPNSPLNPSLPVPLPRSRFILPAGSPRLVNQLSNWPLSPIPLPLLPSLSSTLLPG